MDNHARIEYYNESYWIEIDGDNHEIPEHILDQLRNEYRDYSRCLVHYDNDEYEPFFQNMKEHPRLDEFMNAEIDALSIDLEHVAPIVVERFLATWVSRVIGAKIGEIEEFIDHRRNQKPAHNC